MVSKQPCCGRKYSFRREKNYIIRLSELLNTPEGLEAQNGLLSPFKGKLNHAYIQTS